MAVETTFFVHEYPTSAEQSRELLQVLGADHIHDVFADYEKKFGKGRMKAQSQKRKAPHDSSKNSGSSTDSVTHSLYRDESRAVADDVSIKQPAEVVDDDLGLGHISGAKPGDMSRSQSSEKRQKDFFNHFGDKDDHEPLSITYLFDLELSYLQWLSSGTIAS
jgi:hypothetical protein